MGSILEGKNWGDGQQSDEIWKENMHRSNTQCREWCQLARQSRQIQTLVPPPKKTRKVKQTFKTNFVRTPVIKVLQYPSECCMKEKGNLKMVGKLQYFYLPLPHPDTNSVAVLKVAIWIPSVEL